MSEKANRGELFHCLNVTEKIMKCLDHELYQRIKTTSELFMPIQHDVFINSIVGIIKRVGYLQHCAGPQNNKR